MKGREQILAEGKMDRNIGMFVYGLMWAQAVSSTGAIQSIRAGKKWLSHANQVIADFEKQTANTLETS